MTLKQKIERARQIRDILAGLLAIIRWAEAAGDDRIRDHALKLYSVLVDHGAIPGLAKPLLREVPLADLPGLVGQTVRTVTARGDDFKGVVQKVSTLAVLLQGANGASKVFPLTNGFFRA